METAANKRKLTVRIYHVDEDTLNESTAALSKLLPDLGVERSDVLRALVHLTPLLEIEALGILRHRYERKGGALPADDICDRPLTLRLPTEDVEKLEAVVKTLKGRNVLTSEAELLRALAQYRLDWAKFAPAFVNYLSEFPDGRELRWKLERS